MRNSSEGGSNPSRNLQPWNRRNFLKSSVVAGVASALPRKEEEQKKRKLDSSRPLRVALAGQDGHTGIVLDSLVNLPNAILVGFSKSRPQDDTAEFQQHPAFGRHTQIYHDYHEMIEKEEIDCLAACMPYYQNAEVSIHAARKGIHVVSEKPAATTIEELVELEAVVRRAGIHYSILLNMRAMPIFQAARSAILEGKVGEPVLLDSQKSYKFGPSRPWFYRERKTYGGTIPWVGIHCIDYMRWVSGQEYAEVAAHHGNKAHPESPGCEDHAGALFRLANGGTAVCHLDYLRPEAASGHGDDRLRIAGKEGVLEVMEKDDRVTVISNSGKSGQLPLPSPVDFFSSFVSELRGEGKHIVESADAFRITRVVLLARQAADTGSWMKLL
jgi:predicted dehydrogenase